MRLICIKANMRKLLLATMALIATYSFGQKKWSLQECVTYALENNLQVLSNQYNQDIQALTLETTKKQKLPGVSGSLSNNLSFGQQRYVNLVQRNDNFNNSANLSADVLLYNHNRLEKAVQKASYELDASRYDVETIKNNIALQIAEQYLTILLNKEIVAINQSALENATYLFDRAKITTEVGTTAQIVLAEAQASMAREKQNVITAEVNVDRGLFNLAQLLQLENYKDFDIENVILDSDLNAPLIAGETIVQTAYENQPEIKAAQYRIQAAEEQTEITKTAFYPTVSLSAGVGTFYFNQLNQGRDTTFFKQYSENFGQQIGLSANIPIFNKGITKLQVEQAKINESIAQNTLLQQKQTVKQNVQLAQFDAESNYESYLAALEAERSSTLALDFAEKSYEAGKSTIYDLNNARNSSANAKGSVAQAKYNYLFSLKLLNFYQGIPITL